LRITVPSYTECGDVLTKARRVAEAASFLVGVRAVLIGSETYQAELVRVEVRMVCLR